MSSYSLQIKARDLLFLRDARPMAASDAGLGANWPRPDQLWSALIHHFHRLWPERQEWEGLAHSKTAQDLRSNPLSSDRFGALQSIGPFPLRAGMAYFPCPLDLAASGEDDEAPTLSPMDLTSAEGTNLPAPLRWAFRSPVLGKKSPPRWLAADDMERYLAGESFTVQAKPTLYDSERHIGIAIDPDTRSASEKQFYQAEYLRLRDDVSLACLVSCMLKPKGRGGQLVDLLAKCPRPASLIMGGQQGVVSLEDASWSLPNNKAPASFGPKPRIRWTLLSPAVFPRLAPSANNPQGHPGGWLPSWIEPQQGAVRLPIPGGDSERRPGEDRRAWRLRRQQQPAIAARLIAARVGKPEYFSGWDMRPVLSSSAEKDADDGAKPTQAAVPAGSVYVFECEDEKAAAALWQALNAQNDGELPRRSAVFGEKGFGLGLCSVMPQNRI